MYVYVCLCVCVYIYVCEWVYLYIRMPYTCHPGQFWSQRLCTVPWISPIISYLGDNLSSGLKVSFVVCHCTGADRTQTGPGRNRETAFSVERSVAILQPQTVQNLRVFTLGGMWLHRALRRHDGVCSFARLTRADRCGRQVCPMHTLTLIP